jgi:hypothetical protein
MARLAVFVGALAFAVYLIAYGWAISDATVRSFYRVGSKAVTGTPPTPPTAQPAPKPPTIRETLLAQGFTEAKADRDTLRFEKRTTSLSEHVDELDVRLVRANAQIAAVRVINVHSECSWKFGSATEFVFHPNSRCPLEKLLKEQVYTDRFRRARDLVFVGLDSFPGDETVSRANLTMARAGELARVTHQARPQLLQVDRKFWLLDLGRATIPTERGTLQEAWQRSAVIIGIDERDASVPLLEVIRTVTTGTKLRNVDLSAYTKSAEATPVAIKSIQVGWVITTEEN